jgi:hypothetical protein
VLLMIVGNLGLTMNFVLMADRRLAEIEQQMELTMAGREAWQGDLVSVRKELGVEVANLRSALTELGREVGADEADLRSGLDELESRVGRIEGMVSILWRAPATAPQVSSVIPSP